MNILSILKIVGKSGSILKKIKKISPGKILAFLLSIFRTFQLDSTLDAALNPTRLSQIPNCFPNDNTKRIDYVIVYKSEKPKNKTAKKDDDKADDDKKEEGEDEEKNDSEELENNKEERKKRRFRKKTRKAFLKKLKEEGFEVERLQWDGDDDDEETQVFVLLHCSLKRLFEEAENAKLQMRLNNVDKINIFYKKNIKLISFSFYEIFLKLFFDYDESGLVEIKWVRCFKDLLFRQKSSRKDENGTIRP